jgi:glyoxylase-like metal-dependent hydrolase (beta-lactamase superfamily II)
VGTVNAYLLEGATLTLVDCGPNSAIALEALVTGIEGTGHAVEEIDLIVLTHHHVDHIGLAGVLSRWAGAEVAALTAAAPYLADWTASSTREDAFREALLYRHGVEANVLASLRPGARLLRGWGAPVSIDVMLSPGESLRCGDRQFEVAHRPGHSPADTLLTAENGEVILGGDHLIPHISSNALLSHPLQGGEPNERPQALVTYRSSLARTRADRADVFLGGHGSPIEDHVALIDARLHEQDLRAERLLEIVKARPSKAHEIAVELWGEVALTQVLLTMSEVLGHLDLLRDAGEIVELGDERFSWFEPAP